MDEKVAFGLLSRAHRSCVMESPHESEAWQALKSAVEIANNIQQLKAEIAAMIDWYDAPMGIGGNTVNRTQLLAKLRQLSAV
jgi:hypothetical protein